MSSSNSLPVKYSNFLSRLFLKPLYKNQWVIPDPPPAILGKFLRWYERKILYVDITHMEIDRPIFLISLPRCGSSMLQDIICTHPEVGYINNMMHTFRDCFCAAEYFRRRFNFNVRGERFLKDSVEVDGGSPADPVGTWAEWFKQDPFEVGFYNPAEISLTTDEIEVIKTGIRKVMWCFGGNAKRFECKTPALLPHALLLKEIFPDAKFIHLIRDAGASANSLLKLYHLTNEQLRAIRRRKGQPQPKKPFIPFPRLAKLSAYIDEFGPDDIRTTAHLWNDGVTFIREINHLLPNFYEVRYEDILAAPRDEILKILDFCELDQPKKDVQLFWEKLNGVGVVHHTNRYGIFPVVEEICRENMLHYGYL